MEGLSLYINDLSLHDNSRDMVLAGFQHASQLEYSIDKVGNACIDFVLMLKLPPVTTVFRLKYTHLNPG